MKYVFFFFFSKINKIQINTEMQREKNKTNKQKINK